MKITESAVVSPNQANLVEEPSKKFAFGQNWQQFLGTITPERIEIAKESILSFFNLKDLKGKTFVDVGCGSGLFSLCAYLLGAKKVVSFDVDTDSIGCCQQLHKRENYPENWEILKLSALDAQGVKALGTFDIVYSFGVLHHTGKMWTAIENATQLVADGGLFFMTIYNKKKGLRGSSYWHWRKKVYVSSPRIVQYMTQGWQWFYFLQNKILRFKNPCRILREYQAKRGMSWKHDMIDWIGGFPYEYATTEELFHGVRRLKPNFQLVNVKGTDGLGTNWLLFQNSALASDNFTEKK